MYVLITFPPSLSSPSLTPLSLSPIPSPPPSPTPHLPPSTSLHPPSLTSISSSTSLSLTVLEVLEKVVDKLEDLNQQQNKMFAVVHISESNVTSNQLSPFHIRKNTGCHITWLGLSF